jgi:hypothetical protein
MLVFDFFFKYDLTGIVSPQRKLSISLSNISSNEERSSFDLPTNFPREDPGLPFTPRYVDPASCKLSY